MKSKIEVMRGCRYAHMRPGAWEPKVRLADRSLDHVWPVS